MVCTLYLILYFLSDEIKKSGVDGACSLRGEKMHREFIWENQTKITLAKFRRRWGDNIKIDIQEVRCEGMD
jgi:hypothetical protein